MLTPFLLAFVFLCQGHHFWRNGLVKGSGKTAVLNKRSLRSRMVYTTIPVPWLMMINPTIYFGLITAGIRIWPLPLAMSDVTGIMFTSQLRTVFLKVSIFIEWWRHLEQQRYQIALAMSRVATMYAPDLTRDRMRPGVLMTTVWQSHLMVNLSSTIVGPRSQNGMLVRPGST